MPGLISSLIQAESSGNPTATSIKGARGLMQITQPALDDFNLYQKKSYVMDDMFDEGKNREVGRWYFADRIPKMLNAYQIEDTVENRLWAYNAGIGNVRKGIKPQETVNYIKKITGMIRGGE